MDFVESEKKRILQKIEDAFLDTLGNLDDAIKEARQLKIPEAEIEAATKRGQQTNRAIVAPQQSEKKIPHLLSVTSRTHQASGPTKLIPHTARIIPFG